VWRRCLRLVLKSRACATRKESGTRAGRNVKWSWKQLNTSSFSLTTPDHGGIGVHSSSKHTSSHLPLKLAYIRFPSQSRRARNPCVDN